MSLSQLKNVNKEKKTFDNVNQNLDVKSPPHGIKKLIKVLLILNLLLLLQMQLLAL